MQSPFLGLSLHETLCTLGFSLPDASDTSRLNLPNGNILSFGDVCNANKRVNLYSPSKVQLWHVAVHRLPLSIISAILTAAISDNQ